jgi:cysteine/O-acetylserine efflux protein
MDPAIIHWLSWAGAAYILWLALKIATSPATNDDLRSEPISFWASFGLQFVNVKSFCTALPRYPSLYYRTLRTHTG